MRHGSGRRSERLSDLILREIAMMLAEDVADPRLSLVTVSGVRLNPDISMAEIYVTFSEDLHPRAEVESALGRAKGFLRRELGHRLKLRKVPDLRFRFDQFLEDMVYEHPERH